MNAGFGLITMKIVMRFISLILVCLPLVVHSDDDGSSKGPGSTACLYYGDIDTLCNISTLNVDQLPEDCSTIMFMDASPYDNFTVTLSMDSQIENLNALLKSKKKVFLYYSHVGYPLGWPTALDNNLEDGGQSARCEMEGLKAFFEQYPGITGLVLVYLDAGVFPKNYSCPTEKFKVYLEAMREAFPELVIGLDFASKTIINFDFNPVGQWLDFSVLDCLIDFYIINMYQSHTCTPDLIQIGGYPLTGNHTYTLDKAMKYLAKVNVPKEKCLIQFTTASTSTDDSVDPCSLSNTMLCTNPADFCEMCSDTPGTYLEKGRYAKENANGFVIDCIDADDPGAVCCCPSGPFPAFRALLDGFNGADSTQCCPKYEIFGT